MTKRAPHPPLPPVFINQRARREEHDRFMTQARRRYGQWLICPDCYRPPRLCVHMPRPR